MGLNLRKADVLYLKFRCIQFHLTNAIYISKHGILTVRSLVSAKINPEQCQNLVNECKFVLYSKISIFFFFFFTPTGFNDKLLVQFFSLLISWCWNSSPDSAYEHLLSLQVVILSGMCMPQFGDFQVQYPMEHCLLEE